MTILVYVLGFLLVTISSFQLGKQFTKIKLPVITGYLLIGIAAGPYILKLIQPNAIPHLDFLNDFSLGFIALAAGTELYLKELKHSIKSIAWNTTAQLVATFVLTSITFYYLASYIPFTASMTAGSKIAVSILVGTILVARSPSSAIAIINEMRAKGPFVRTAMGVTVVKDILVIILFSICLSLSQSLINGIDVEWTVILKLLFELALSFLIGFAFGKLLELVFSSSLSNKIKTVIILAMGFGMFQALHYGEEYIHHHFDMILRVEALLVVLLGSFYVTNFTKHRLEFQEMMEHNGPWIYVIFFTLTGASLSLDVLVTVWKIALVLFFVRLISMIIAAYIGGTLAGDEPLHKKYGWMPYVTQAGVGIGLATEIAGEYTIWGNEFYTIVVSVIVINQIVGPPLFKYAIQKVGEAHTKGKNVATTGKKALIFGFENQSVALARQLLAHNWKTIIVSCDEEKDKTIVDGVEVMSFAQISKAMFKKLNAQKADTIVLFLSDEENYALNELIYEHLGTKDVLVRLQDRSYLERFKELGAHVIDPASAFINLMDHYVRSPIGTSLLLGGDKNQDTLDVEVIDSTMDGKLLRDIRLPSDVIILSLKHNGKNIIMHGYTEIRVGDILSVVGSNESLDKVAVMFGDLA